MREAIEIIFLPKTLKDWGVEIRLYIYILDTHLYGAEIKKKNIASISHMSF